mmetsp:Transcript_17163/g.25725  ORF Transcript_17163/g.25725 Transcript_17163/m.25725 type:complete len:120 (+) Transcript_17163:7137-7496(+)
MVSVRSCLSDAKTTKIFFTIISLVVCGVKLFKYAAQYKEPVWDNEAVIDTVDLVEVQFLTVIPGANNRDGIEVGSIVGNIVRGLFEDDEVVDGNRDKVDSEGPPMEGIAVGENEEGEAA